MDHLPTIRRHTLQALDPGDVLNVLDDLLAQEPDPTKHPCFPLVNWLLGRQWAVNGGTFWDQWKQLTLQAIDRLVDARV
jgi:hypothetical protein